MLLIVDCGLRIADWGRHRGAAVPGRSDVGKPIGRTLDTTDYLTLLCPHLPVGYQGALRKKADGGCKNGAKMVERAANRPPLPAIARLVRLCPPFFNGGGLGGRVSEYWGIGVSAGDRTGCGLGGFLRADFRFYSLYFAYFRIYSHCDGGGAGREGIGVSGCRRRTRLFWGHFVWLREDLCGALPRRSYGIEMCKNAA
jgi:hypothetical protein